MTVLIVAILLLVAMTALLHLVIGRTRPEDLPEVVQPEASCATCTGEDSKCEQECMMEAATKEIQYFDDEELDRYKGYASCQYDEEQADEFREVMYTMKESEVKEWVRSLTLREINVPDQIKDELIMLLRMLVVVVLITSCSTSKNTSGTRWWHSFNARYNTMYNGTEAFLEGDEEKLQGNMDDYTEILPMFIAANKKSKDTGKGKYDRAIEKSQKAIQRHSIKKRPEWTKSRKKTERDIEWLNRKEYNPYLWRAWFLMGRSQFQKGEFNEAASTFSYMSRLYRTQPAIYGNARAWLARSYAQMDWLYDAEDVIKNMSRDSIDWRAQKAWDATLADFKLRSGLGEEAIPYLRKAIKAERNSKLRARLWFIMGQTLSQAGRREEAYDAYKRVIRANPPYQLEFNARISMTEVMANGRTKQMIGKLKAMARSDKNKEYLDQVYYAMGNIYMLQKDTLSAIGAYEKGVAKAERAGTEKGVLLLTLGNLYWNMERYADAQRCYGEAIGLLDQDRKGYKELSRRSMILDELVPHTESIHLQDSLQELARMPEAERLAAIDRVIEALKKKEKEERKRELEREAEQNRQQNEAANNNRQNKPTVPTSSKQESVWYFYNPQAVSQGKQTFAQLWGKRDNADDWRRSNRTVVQFENAEVDYDNINDDGTVKDDSEGASDKKEEEATDTLKNDPHNREYYLAQIPFTEEQIEASNIILQEALYNAGVIFKDKLDNLSQSEKCLVRDEKYFPEYEKMPEIFYHLFLLHSRRGDKAKANEYLEKMQQRFAEHDLTKLLSDPYFEENARFGTHLEDSLYAATYNAFKENRREEVSSNVELSEQRFPLGAHRDKFIFIEGMQNLNDGKAKECEEAMKTVVEKYPQSEVAALAGMIMKGVQSGRRLYGGSFDLNDIWDRRSAESVTGGDSTAMRLSEERNTPFTFMLVYQPDSVNENQMLYELARYNFTTFMVRNFDITMMDDGGLRRMQIAGFMNYDEALQYARQLYASEAVAEQIRHCRTIIIGEHNLSLLGVQYSYNEYQAFYDKNFAPLEISTEKLLNLPESIDQPLDPEDMPEEGEDDYDEDYEEGNDEPMDDLDRILFGY